MRYPIFLLFISVLTISCTDKESTSSIDLSGKASLVNFNYDNFDQFKEYWYTQKAELSVYDLKQNKYGEEHDGHAVLIFVTEPFSKSKQVKLDYPTQASGGDNIPVLKLNKINRFVTGIYDYSLMESVFTPISIDEYPHTLKVTSSTQDWCGQTFAQLNYQEGQYNLKSFSYFESEADSDSQLDNVMLEDELFNRIRINPESIPTGNSDLIPSLFYSRTAHQPLHSKKARISFKSKNEATSQCIVEYLHLDRTVNITFESSFPHSILQWEEINDGQTTVKAIKRKTIRSPYWKQNTQKDLFLRDSLGLSIG